MVQQIINTGTSPNDGTGDSLNAGGDKINDNFDELYTFKARLASSQAFTSRSAAQASSIASEVETIAVLNNGRVLTYGRDAGGTALITSGSVKWSPLDSAPSIFHWGGAGDGSVDDTAAIRALHLWCNAKRIAPSYTGVSVVSIDANAQIIVNTSVDFCGAKIALRNGMQSPADEANQYVAFIVEDAATPLINTTVTPTSANLALKSYASCADFAVQNGFALFYLSAGSGLPLISNRDADATMSFRMCHRTYADGKTQYPMSVDASGATELFTQKRADPINGWIGLCNFSLEMAGLNSQVLFDIKRNLVEIDMWNLIASSSDPALTYHRIIRAQSCAALKLRNGNGLGPANNLSKGSYVFQPNFVADLHVIDCSFRGGWDFNGSNNCNGMHFHGGALRRIDTHAYSENIFVSDVDLIGRGVAIGQGGGVLHVSKSRFFQIDNAFSFIVGSREDYGNEWYGDIAVSDCVYDITSFGTNGHFVVDFFSNPVGNTVAALEGPRQIVVSDIVFQRRNVTVGARYEISGVSIAVKSAAAGYGRPSQVVVSDLSCTATWRLFNHLALSDMAARSAALNPTMVSIRNCFPSDAASAAGTKFTLNVPIKTVTSGVVEQITLRAANCDNLSVQTPGLTSTSSLYRIGNCSINRVLTGAAHSLDIYGCNMVTPVILSGETYAPIGSFFPSAGRYGLISGGRAAGAFDLTKVGGLAGLCTAASDVGTLQLPSGATRATALTGWMSAAIA